MRLNTVAGTLLILSVVSFVLAAPVPEVHEAWGDVVEGDENVIVVSGKRAPGGNPSEGDSDLYPYNPYDGDSDESDLYPPDQSYRTPPQSPSPSAHDDASGRHPFDPAQGAFKPETTTENQPAASSSTGKPKKVDWHHTTKVHIYEPAIYVPPPEGPSSSASSVKWAPSREVILPSGETFSETVPPDPLPLPPGRKGYLAKVAAGQQPPPPEFDHASPSSFFEPPPPEPKSKSLVSKVTTSLGKLGKLKFVPRF